MMIVKSLTTRTFRRAGVSFAPSGTRIDPERLGEAAMAMILADPHLQVVADGSDAGDDQEQSDAKATKPAAKKTRRKKAAG